MRIHPEFFQGSFNVIAGTSASFRTGFLAHRAVVHSDAGFSVLYLSDSVSVADQYINKYKVMLHDTTNITVESIPTGWIYDSIGDILIDGKHDVDVCIIDSNISDTRGLRSFILDFRDYVTMYSTVQLPKRSFSEPTPHIHPRMMELADNLILTEFGADTGILSTTYLKSITLPRNTTMIYRLDSTGILAEY